MPRQRWLGRPLPRPVYESSRLRLSPPLPLPGPPQRTGVGGRGEGWCACQWATGPTARPPPPSATRSQVRSATGSPSTPGGDSAKTDLYVAVRQGSPEATAAFNDTVSQMLNEWAEQKPGELNSHGEKVVEEAAAEIVGKVAADTLEADNAKELDDLRIKGGLSEADAEYRYMAYCVGLSTAAEMLGNVSVSGHAPVDEEAESAAEKQFWGQAFHTMRNSRAHIPSDLLGSDVHDAVVAMAAVRRHIRWERSKEKWFDVKEVLKSDGGRFFFMHEKHGERAQWVNRTAATR